MSNKNKHQIGDEVYCLNSKRRFNDNTIYVIHNFIGNDEPYSVELHEKGGVWTEDNGGYFKLPNGDKAFCQFSIFNEILSVKK